MLGTGILWFGWFGFNAGSALAADGRAVQAFINTFLASAAAGLARGVVERLRDGHFTNLGVASGIANGVTIVFSLAVSFALAKVLDVTIGLRATEEREISGLDTSEHAETAYSTAEMARDRVH